MSRLALLGPVLVALAACGPAKEPRHASLRMSGGPTWATVTIDDIFVGRLDFVAARGVGLPVGKHHLTVEAPGFFPYDAVIEATDAAPLRVAVQLVAIPD